MFGLPRFSIVSRIAVSGMITGALSVCSGTVLAQQATSGFGTSFPQAKNVSQDPRWRVYVFQKDGVRYFQINNATGVVQAAIATANGAVLVLPMGASASRVSTRLVPNNGVVEPIYRDDGIHITVQTTTNGTTQFTATPTPGANTANSMSAMCAGKPDCGGDLLSR